MCALSLDPNIILCMTLTTTRLSNKHMRFQRAKTNNSTWHITAIYNPYLKTHYHHHLNRTSFQKNISQQKSGYTQDLTKKTMLEKIGHGRMSKSRANGYVDVDICMNGVCETFLPSTKPTRSFNFSPISRITSIILQMKSDIFMPIMVVC